VNAIDILIIAAVVAAVVAASIYAWKHRGSCGGNCSACRLNDGGCKEPKCRINENRPERKDQYPDCAACRFRDGCPGKKEKE